MDDAHCRRKIYKSYTLVSVQYQFVVMFYKSDFNLQLQS